MSFSLPWVLWLLPLSLLPVLLNRQHHHGYSSLALLPADPLSDLVGILLKMLAMLAIAAALLGMADPHTLEQSVERTGVGAQIVLVLDRSASMDDPFSGSAKAAGDNRVGETKSVAASRIISSFVKSRKNDMFGMITFSNSAMYVLPLAENKQAILAAIQATAGNALFQTNIGSGLTAAVGLFEKVPDSGSRAMILLSDGAGRMSAEMQQKLKDWLDKRNIGLYWIVLRQPGGLSIFDTTYKPKEDQALPPQIELNEYFKTLKTPFHAYEADDPKSLEAAVSDINQREKKPIRYMEKIPGKHYASACFSLAIVMTLLLLLVQFLEIRTWQTA